MQEAEIRKLHEAKVKRWDNSSLGAQIGGITHDAVAIAIAEKKITKANIKKWIDILYDLAEEKKQPQPVSFEAAQKATEEFNKKMEEADNQQVNAELEEIRITNQNETN